MAEETKRSFARRDHLLEIQSQVQRWWSEGDVFKAESKEALPKPGEKFYGNFPFPYINGYLHLGHAFSLSKLEFAAAYHRLRGANVLLPFAFHGTGMPIKASADKITREIEKFGNPPVFQLSKRRLVPRRRNRWVRVRIRLNMVVFSRERNQRLLLKLALVSTNGR